MLGDNEMQSINIIKNLTARIKLHITIYRKIETYVLNQGCKMTDQRVFIKKGITVFAGRYFTSLLLHKSIH